jgi:hypothetical protein
MSTEVTLGELATTLEGYGFGYVLSSRDDGQAHISAVHATVRDGALRVVDAGDRTRRHIAARPSITMLWPPLDQSGYSLIVDGVATLGDGEITVAPTRAVLHRPAPPREAAAEPDGSGACVSDCVEVGLE